MAIRRFLCPPTARCETVTYRHQTLRVRARRGRTRSPYLANAPLENSIPPRFFADAASFHVEPPTNNERD
eukprot:2079401-Pyramimonas_sp.AAC.1